MRPASKSEFAASKNRTVPKMERVREHVWTHPVRHPNRQIRYTLSYLIRDAENSFHVIDPGWDSDENFDEFAEALSRLGGSVSQLASIIVTHWHGDHLGMAERLRQASNAPIVMHRIEWETIDALVRTREQRVADRKLEFENWGVDTERRPELIESIVHVIDLPVGPRVIIEDDGVFAIPGHPLQVIRTPGHTFGHICLRDAKAQLLFTGDHVLPTINPGLGLGGIAVTDPIRGYLESLQSLVGLDDHEICPAHEYRFHGLRERCESLITHHTLRAEEIANAMRTMPDATIWELARNVSWSAGWDRLGGFLLYSALMQTALYTEFLAGSIEGRSASSAGSAAN